MELGGDAFGVARWASCEKLANLEKADGDEGDKFRRERQGGETGDGFEVAGVLVYDRPYLADSPHPRGKEIGAGRGKGSVKLPVPRKRPQVAGALVAGGTVEERQLNAFGVTYDRVMVELGFRPQPLAIVGRRCL